MIGEAFTLARNFGPWFAGVALAAFLAGGWGGYKVGAWQYQTAALKAEKALADFRSELATQGQAAEAEAARRQVEALQAIGARDAAVSAAIDASASRVISALAPKFEVFRNATAAPSFNCLRDPLPVDALRVFERPGGTAP